MSLRLGCSTAGTAFGQQNIASSNQPKQRNQRLNSSCSLHAPRHIEQWISLISAELQILLPLEHPWWNNKFIHNFEFSSGPFPLGYFITASLRKRTCVNSRVPGNLKIKHSLLLGAHYLLQSAHNRCLPLNLTFSILIYLQSKIE